LKDQQSRELRIIRTTCPAVYVYDNANEYTKIRSRRNEEQKADKEKKRYYTRMAVLQSSISPWKKEGKKREKNYYYTGDSNLVTHPSTNPAEQGLTSLSRRNMFLVIVTLR